MDENEQPEGGVSEAVAVAAGAAIAEAGNATEEAAEATETAEEAAEAAEAAQGQADNAAAATLALAEIVTQQGEVIAGMSNRLETLAAEHGELTRTMHELLMETEDEEEEVEHENVSEETLPAEGHEEPGEAAGGGEGERTSTEVEPPVTRGGRRWAKHW